METQNTTAGGIKKKQIRVQRGSIGAFPAGKVAGLTVQFSAAVVADHITASPVVDSDGVTVYSRYADAQGHTAD